MKPRRRVRTLAACAAAAVLCWLAYQFALPGVRVGLTNQGPDTLRNVIVHVTGRSYPLGDVPARESRSVRVRPASESHVEIEFTDARGTSARVVADCYFEPGYRGEIWIDMKDGRVERARDSVSLY
jgi:hypothetical protein